MTSHAFQGIMNLLAILNVLLRPFQIIGLFEATWLKVACMLLPRVTFRSTDYT
jgi:hypothetical protein